MRQKLVAGNWKMHGGLQSNLQLLQGVLAGVADLKGMSAAVCVPFPYLAQAQSVLTGTPIAWGAQNLSEQPQGAFTGEVSAAMLNDFSCKYVLVGHSERRAIYGETDALVAEKFAAALAAGLRPVLCVGETLAQRDAGQTIDVVSAQIEAVLKRVGVAAFADAVIAYEPVWAIGTGRTATAAQAQEVHAAIRAQIARADAKVAEGLQILYGGSMKPGNAAELLAMPDIDGGLIGGAALVAADFLAICRAAVCVPFPYLAQAQSVLTGTPIAWGAQNLSEQPQGAFTGEVSAAMLNDFSCKYVIVGHSERRAIYGESDALVAEKFAAALAAGLRPVLCVGETLAQRDAGQTIEVVSAQIEAVLKRVGVAAFADAVIAYEPVWAIGTGRTATAAQAQEVHAAIRAQIARADAKVAEGLQILYGGSMKPGNAAELLAMPDIDGGLIGGAALVAADFLAICRAAVQ